MPPSSPLTPTSYVVLGLLHGGASTSYDLEQAVAACIGHFWSFPRSQLYSEPARLAELGLVSLEQEQTGRRRRTATLTEAGRAALQAWLAEPQGAATEIRDLGLLKLFFASAAASPADVAASARAQRDSHAHQLAVYEQLAEVPAIDVHQRQTLLLGLAYERAAVEFWEQVAGDADG